MRLKEKYQEKRIVSEDGIVRGPTSYRVSLQLPGDGNVAEGKSACKQGQMKRVAVLERTSCCLKSCDNIFLVFKLRVRAQERQGPYFECAALNFHN